MRPHPEQSCDQVQMTIPGEPLAVRHGLAAMLCTKVLLRLPEDERGTAEIVLAEALNNIVEHAYACHSGLIEIKLSLFPGGLDCEIADTGLPMPGDNLPEGKLKPILPGEELPEGGFGWFLIRTLSQDLRYRRQGDKNLLTFRLKSEQTIN